VDRMWRKSQFSGADGSLVVKVSAVFMGRKCGDGGRFVSTDG